MTRKERVLEMLKTAIDRNDNNSEFCILIYSTTTLEAKILKYGYRRFEGLYKYIKKRFDRDLFHKKKNIMITSCCISSGCMTREIDFTTLQINESYVMYGDSVHINRV